MLRLMLQIAAVVAASVAVAWVAMRQPELNPALIPPPTPIYARSVVVELGKDVRWGSPIAEMVDSLGYHRVLFMSELPAGTTVGDTLTLIVGYR